MKRFSRIVACVSLMGVSGIVAAKPAPTKRMGVASASNLARVVAVETRSDEVQELMDVKLWNFDVRFPATAKSSKQFLVLEQRRRGHAPENLLRLPLSSFSTSRRLHISIGLYPPDGDMMHSKKIKYRIRTHYFNSDGKAMPSFTASAVIANPFDEMKATYPGGNGKAVPQKDGGFLLFGGSKDSGGWSLQTLDDISNDKVSASSFDAALVFRIR